MAAGEVEVLLVVGGLDVDREAEAKLLNMHGHGDMGERDGSDKSYSIATVEEPKENKKSNHCHASTRRRYHQ